MYESELYDQFEIRQVVPPITWFSWTPDVEGGGAPAMPVDMRIDARKLTLLPTMLQPTTVLQGSDSSCPTVCVLSEGRVSSLAASESVRRHLTYFSDVAGHSYENHPVDGASLQTLRALQHFTKARIEANPDADPHAVLQASAQMDEKSMVRYSQLVRETGGTRPR